MKFPLLVIDQKEYEKQLTDLLDNPDCLLLFDTNILSQMFSLHRAARAEFATWLASRKVPQNRVTLPAWCLHEYTNKAIRNQLRDYIPVGSSISNTVNYSRQLLRHLAMATDDTAAKGHNHDGRAAFMEKLDKAHTAFVKLLPKPDTDEDTVAAVHDELMAMFGDCVAPSDIFALLKDCQADYEMRYDNHLPPGFLDSHKDKNKFGDYIIWREILAIAREKGFRTFVYVSNDGKKDWVYAPLKAKRPSGELVENSVKKNGAVIRLIDPRLEHELSLAAEEEATIMLVTFEQLVKMLVRQDGPGFTLLAEAVQLTKEQAPKEARSAGTAPAPPDNAPATGPTTPVTPTLAPTTTPATPTVVDLPGMQYPNWVLADADYEELDTPIGHAIELLQVYAWDFQNSAINNLKVRELNEATFEELFVLGRNILQAATGSSFAAIEFIGDFPGRVAAATPTALQHLFNGMLYEVYFDSDNLFRYSKGKCRYLSELCVALKKHAFLRPCAQFIARELEPYAHYVLFLPLLNQVHCLLTLSFTTDKQTFAPLPVLESCSFGEDREPISINIPPGMDTPAEAEVRYLDSYSRNIGALSTAVAFSRYIPSEFVTTVCVVDGQQVPTVARYRVPDDLAV